MYRASDAWDAISGNDWSERSSKGGKGLYYEHVEPDQDDDFNLDKPEEEEKEEEA